MTTKRRISTPRPDQGKLSRPEDVGEGKAVKKKRRKASAKDGYGCARSAHRAQIRRCRPARHRLTHVSALKAARKRSESYQRLEFLGDHVLGLIVSDMLYRAFPNADEASCRSGFPNLCARRVAPMWQSSSA